MSVNGRSPSRLLVFALALPVFALVYVTTFGARLWAALRPAVATFLGVSVIGSVYAETAYRKTPTPVRAAAVVALSVVLVAPQFAAPPRVAAADPAQAVISAAKQYLGHHFQIGAEGPGPFDCSGLVFRAFSDAGELPRIGGMRLRAAGYMQYFVSRGRFTKDESQAQPGDLVIYDMGVHVGIYLGNDRVISALIDPWGVSITSVHGLHLPVSYYLQVNWGGGDSGNTGGNNGGDNGNGNDNNGNGNNGGSGNSIDQPSNAGPGSDGTDTGGATGGDNNGGNTGGDNNGGNTGGDNNNGGDTGGQGVTGGHGTDALALGTMNLRSAADPGAQIIGWIGRGGSFKVVDQGTSPAGYVWFKVQTKSGKEGWVYSRWVKELN